MSKKLIWVGIPVIAILAYFTAGTKTNPGVERTVDWDYPETQDLFSRACANCHSNETRWPWYANIAPSSWLVIHNVNEGREHFNISLKKMGDADEAHEEVAKGAMPPWDYLILHPEAKLNAEEKERFIRGLKNTFNSDEESLEK